MKKIILMTACTAAVLLSGCSDNELASAGDGIRTSTQNAIGFHVVGNQAETRATPITPTNITSTNFKVFAFTRNENGTDGNFFMGEKADETTGQNGIKIDYTKGNWDYANASDIHYWPVSTPLNFYAVSPDYNPTVLPTYSWVINKDTKTIYYSSCDEYGGTTGEQNLDVMYAIKTNQTKDTNDGKVKFQFKHILSQVVFKAKKETENIEVEINGIKIHNFKLGGTYTLPTISAIEGATEGTTEGTWTFNELSKPTGISTVVKEKNISVTSSGADISVDTPMLFVPQSLTAWDVQTPKTKHDADQAGESYLEINCKIKHKQDGAYILGSDTEYGTLYVPFGPTWKQGKRYTYTLIFGGGYDDQGKAILQPINFDAEVDAWTDATESVDVKF